MTKGDLLKNTNGGCILFSRSEILSLAFNSKVYFTKSFGSDETVTSVGLISASHVMVGFESRRYFDIYDIFTGQLAMRKEFDGVIRFLLVETTVERINV